MLQVILIKIFVIFYASKLGYSLGSERVKFFNGKKVILEYTKTTDEVNSSSNDFKSYIHYIPSASKTTDVITKDMKDLGVQILDDYIYDTEEDSCSAE